MIKEDAPVNNVGSGVGVPGAGVTSAEIGRAHV